MAETIAEKAKRYLLDDFNLLEKFGIDFSNIIEDFENMPNDLVSINKLERRVNKELEGLKIDGQIMDYVLDTSQNTNNIVSLAATIMPISSAEYICIKFDVVKS